MSHYNPTSQRGLAYHCCSKPAFLFADISARKFQNPLKSLTCRLSESLGNNMPGSLEAEVAWERQTVENIARNIKRTKRDSIFIMQSSSWPWYTAIEDWGWGLEEVAGGVDWGWGQLSAKIVFSFFKRENKLNIIIYMLFLSRIEPDILTQ